MYLEFDFVGISLCAERLLDGEEKLEVLTLRKKVLCRRRQQERLTMNVDLEERYAEVR